MAGEWKRSTWDFSPVALAHTPSHIVKAFHSFLTQTGWEYATWSLTADDRYYLRSDRFDCNLVNDAVGTAGNVAISFVGGSITASGMSGGSVSVAATGRITLSAVPSDGNTITISDGVNSKTFEFDSNASVGGGNISVTIGANRADTLDNLMAAINAAATFNVTASLNTMWRFNGDGPTQYCGIRVRYDSANSRVELTCHMENTARTAVQIATPAVHAILISYSLLVVNSFIIYGGEDGLYFECGRDGVSQNVGHAAIMAIKPIPELSGSRDPQIQWTSQGLCCDLFGNLKFSVDRNSRFVDNNGANKNHTAELAPQAARGTSSLTISTQGNAAKVYIAPRDNHISRSHSAVGAGQGFYWCSFGVINSPLDDRYKVSPLWALQIIATTSCAVNSSSASNNVASNGTFNMYEARWTRRIDRFAGVDQTLIPFNNITDQITGLVYRVSRVADGGRNSNIGIEFPATSVTIPATPSV